MALLRRLGSPLPALVGALGAVGLALLYIDHGWTIPILIVGGVGVILGLVYGVGRLSFGRWPYTSGIAMEAGALLGLLIAVVIGAVIAWALLKKAPGPNASPRTNQAYGILSLAATAFLASVLVNPDQPFWNPVKSAIKKVFAQRFTARATLLERDADDAVINNRYGALAQEHRGDDVDGWDWKARRLRTRHIRDALSARGPERGNQTKVEASGA